MSTTQVRCLKDHGEYEMEEGDVVVLKKNTTHYLPMKSCQHLIRDGILQQLEWLMEFKGADEVMGDTYTEEILL